MTIPNNMIRKKLLRYGAAPHHKILRTSLMLVEGKPVQVIALSLTLAD
jgi:hypothetical protein